MVAATGHGERDEYPEAVIPIDEIGTDRVRFDALTDVERKALMKVGSVILVVMRLPLGLVKSPKDT